MTGGKTIIIGGPTASGKSGLALRLAEALDGEVVNADSVQVYRGLDIGSAKPTAAERARVPHHLIDVAGLDEAYDAGRFVAEAEAAIADIHARGRAALVCGGTGLYLRALVYGLVESAPTDEALRAQLQARVQEEGPEALHAALAQVDPVSAARLHPNDAVRVVRALEVHALTGRPLSASQGEHRLNDRQPRLEALQVALGPPREVLYARIDTRVDQMLAQGWVAEVEGILAAGAAPDLKPLGSLGYRQLVGWLTGAWRPEEGFAEVVRQIKRDHRRYAKRQLTWFRNQHEMTWYEDAEEAFEALASC